MNENIDLTQILANCPRGTKFYSKVHGEVVFAYISVAPEHPIVVIAKTKDNEPLYKAFTSNGHLYSIYEDDECLLVPSKCQQDWSKFVAPWLKKDKFNPNSLNAFDKVLVRNNENSIWKCTLFSHRKPGLCTNEYVTSDGSYAFCIPYNDDTKHLVGTGLEEPEFYKYWEE